MSRLVKIMVLPLLLVAILAGLSLTGCGENAAGPDEAGTLNLSQILSDSMLAMKNVNSYKYSMDMDMTMEATGGSSPGKITSTMESSGVADLAAKKMKLDFEMSLGGIALSDQPGDMPQDISAEIYMIVDTLYMKMDVPGMGEQWVKTSLTEEMKQAYNLDTVDQQLMPLESATQIEFVKYESVDGSECYVLKIVPNLESMMEWLEQQQMTGALNLSEVGNLQDIFKELSYITWIAKDTKLIKKLDINMVMEMNAAEFGTSDSDFDKMTLDLDLKMEIKDYNEPVSITLPEEAENAVEM